MYPKDVYSEGKDRNWMPRFRFEFIDDILFEGSGFKLHDEGYKYLELLEKDLYNFQSWIDGVALYKNSQCRNVSQIQHSLKKTFDFNAACIFENIESVMIQPTAGLVLGIDGLMHQLMSSYPILSFDSNGQWHSRDHHALKLDISGVYPRFRYHNYEPVEGINQEDVEFKIHDLGWLYSIVPIMSERIQLARFMSHIALTWVHYHEHGHYMAGHCHFYKAADSDFNFLSECKLDDQNSFDEMNKHIELQADKFGLEQTLNLFYRKEWLPHVPVSIFKNRHIWLLRIIVLSIVSVCLSFRKSQEINGLSSHYPKAFTRIIGILVNAIHFAARGGAHEMKLNAGEGVELLSNLFSDIFISAGFLYSTTDQMDFKEEEYKYGFGPIHLLQDQEESVKLTTAFINMMFIEEKFYRSTDPKILETYFSEYLSLRSTENRNEEILLRFRKMATIPLTVYGEQSIE